MGNPSRPMLQKGCQDINSTFHLCLNTTSLSPNSFLLSLTSHTACNPLQPFQALLDSGLSHSFVNEAFALKNKLKFSYLPKAIPLRMFNRSTTSTINRTCHIPITFSTGESHAVDLFVTKLDEEYSVVLGYDWLIQHNPSIDWLEMKITFCNPKTLLETPSLAPKVIDIQQDTHVCMTHDVGQITHGTDHIAVHLEMHLSKLNRLLPHCNLLTSHLQTLVFWRRNHNDGPTLSW